MKHAVFWDVAPRRSCVDRRFGGNTFLRSVGPHKIYAAQYPRRRHSSNSSKITIYVIVSIREPFHAKYAGALVTCCLHKI
jgi:hypothetical protein